MPKKYYAVRKGLTPGIYETWDECRVQVSGVAGAEYKSFKTKEEAESFMNGTKTPAAGRKKASGAKTNNGSRIESDRGTQEKELAGPILEEGVLTAYVDGSYNSDTKEFSYGIVYLHDGIEEYDSKMVPDKSLAEMHNVAGEIKGAEAAMRYALDHGYKKVIIYHDYQGIAKWCTGEWKTNKEGTKAYASYYNSIKDRLAVQFIKVKGHSNDKYNDMADKLAKQAISIGV